MSQAQDTGLIQTNLLDPYARAHAGKLTWNPAVFGYRMESDDDLSFDERDSAPFVPRCVVVDPNFDWRGPRTYRPVPWNRTIIYESQGIHTTEPAGS